ncbi:hypothetical protein AV530_014534 [Patagioenas fasciata monilis]|uniref:Uncharacterized protein n=1 Tax=Patagioenas fasciata monilis TaxID=372326 RepID=A0A1V4KC36_PATFA|nr:hypothetical protein AV530_014534 [Patagioenas fasciata monilis]
MRRIKGLSTSQLRGQLRDILETFKSQKQQSVKGSKRHKLCGCTGHFIMTCSTSVALSGGCTICFSQVFSEIFLFLDYHKNHRTQF